MRPKLRRFLTLPPVGLAPTEHASISWTHWSAKTLCAHEDLAFDRQRAIGWFRSYGFGTVDDFVVRQSLAVPPDSTDFHKPLNYRGFRSGLKSRVRGNPKICLLSDVTRCDRDPSVEKLDLSRRLRTLVRAAGNRGRTGTGACQPASKRGPWDASVRSWVTRASVIPFRRLSCRTHPCSRMLHTASRSIR
jgi:hypothetical protein